MIKPIIEQSDARIPFKSGIAVFALLVVTAAVVLTAFGMPVLLLNYSHRSGSEGEI